MDLKTNTKGLTTYNEWFISAIKSSKVDGEIQEKKLLQNCLNCHNQVKTATNSSSIEDSYLKVEEFRLNSTILLLLGCPSINQLPDIATCNELMPLIKSIPIIDVDQVFVILKGLKNNKYLRGVLPWLPTELLVELLTTFLNNYKTITPLSLAISFEIFYSLVYSSQYDTIEKESVTSCLKIFVHYLKDNEISSNTPKNNKLMAYYFMYIVECIHLLINYLNNKDISEPFTFSFGLRFKALKNNSERSNELQYESIITYCINVLSSLLNTMVLCISSDIWISWHDTKAPSFGISCPNPVDVDDEKPTEKSIQLQISHSMYNIMKVTNHLDLTTDVLNLNLHKELAIFLKHVAIDPDYDSDNDLSNMELVEAMKKADKVKNRKLVTILLNREDIFDTKECVDCLRDINSIIPKSAALAFMKKFIRLLKNNFKGSEDWKCIVLELSDCLANEDVIFVLKEDLNYGCCDILRTAGFPAHFTQIFNQLSHHSDKECNDSYLRLCLQSGEDVVKYSIDMVLTLPGLSSVLASALRTISFICRSKDADGLGLVTKLLMEKLDDNLTPDSRKEFSVFLVHLLEIPDDEPSFSFECPAIDLLPVDVQEVFERLICPRLKVEDEVDSDILNLLQVLKTIVNLYSEIIMESSLLLSSLISLILLHNNCVRLDSSNCTRNLKMRNCVEQIFRSLEKQILKDSDNFEEKAVLLKIHLSRYELHCRSFFLVSRLINEITSKSESLISGKIRSSDSVVGGMIYKGDSVVDKILHCIMKKTRYNEECQVPSCIRIEWIWALYIILPDCDEAEWLCSFHLTHSYLNVNIGDSNLVTPTLKIFQEVLLLLCDSVSRLQQEKGKRISLSHCFKCFSSASTKFMNEKLKIDENQVYSLINIFIWWCKAQKVFDCDAEYPALFLHHLVTALSDLLTAKKVIIDTGVNSKGINTPNSEGSSKSSSKTGESLEDEINDLTLNESNEDLEIKMDINGTEESKAKKKKKKSSKSKATAAVAKVIPKKEFDEALESMVKVFISSMRPSEVTSAVAGKLKSLCEDKITHINLKMKKLPLKNTETKRIPLGSRIQKEMKANKSTKSKGDKLEAEVSPASDCCENPKPFTTEKLLRSLQEVKNQEPNIAQMVDDKLASPTTAKYARRKKASKVTVLESKKVYQDLVSLDISGTNLFQGIEEDLKRRACAVQPKLRPMDPEPRLEDYFKEEEFVNVRTVGPSNIFPLVPIGKPFSSNKETLNQYMDILLG